jgi:hypothetical protein
MHFRYSDEKKKSRGQGIKKISDLFAKYTKQLRAPEGVVLDAFLEVVKDVFGVTLEKTQCSFSPQTKTLTLRISGPLKSEILMRKKEIIAHIRGRVPGSVYPEEIL